jgi:hypothetical protein
MQPHRIGRVLGIGARVAADKLRERTAQATTQPQRPASTQPAPAVKTPPTAPRPTVPSAPSLAEGSRRMARGAGRFGASVWRPFAHATGVLTLQITGVFFALFTLFFVVHSWQLYKTAGWHDHHLPLYATIALLFAWFAVSSFWRANRKQKRA